MTPDQILDAILAELDAASAIRAAGRHIEATASNRLKGKWRRERLESIADDPA